MDTQLAFQRQQQRARTAEGGRGPRQGEHLMQYAKELDAAMDRGVSPDPVLGSPLSDLVTICRLSVTRLRYLDLAQCTLLGFVSD